MSGSPRLRRVAALPLLLSTAIAALIAGCADVQWFPEFFYSGSTVHVNLVSDTTFAGWELDPTLQTLGDSSEWYMAFEEYTDGSVSAPTVESPLVASSAIYRVEAKSLIPDGDLSTAAVGSVTRGEAVAGWRFYPSADLEPSSSGVHAIVDSGSYTISGNTMYLKTGGGTERVDYAIRDPVYGAVDGFSVDASYYVRFSYRSDLSRVVFEFNNGTNAINDSIWVFYSGTGGSSEGATLTNVTQFPPAYVIDYYHEVRPQDEADYYFTFGSLEVSSNDALNAYIDNFRLVRTDLLPRVELRLPYQLTLPVVGNESSTYALESGRYRFSIWIHDDPTVGTATNRYGCTSVVLTLAAGDVEGASSAAVGTSTYTAVFERGTGGWADADAAGWSCITIETEDSVQIPTDTGSAAVMLITVAPTDWFTEGGKNHDAGSLLIASPILQFISAEPAA